MDKVIVIRHSDTHEETSKSDFQKYTEKHGKHFSDKLLKYATESQNMKNCNNTEHKWSTEDVQQLLLQLHFNIPKASTIEDITYTANMAYADFFPDILTEIQCIKYAMAVANDIDGYEGIQFCRWVSDQMGKGNDVDWFQFT